MEQFQVASSYGQHLKSLSHQLSNVGALDSNQQLVCQLVSRLTYDYAIVSSQIHHGDILPPLYKARFMPIFEETTWAKRAVFHPGNKTFIISQNDNFVGNLSTHPNSSSNRLELVKEQ